jgi:adenylate cyclase
VLEGSVRRGGQRLRVTGQLLDAESGAHIWAERYDGVVEDLFDLQDRISEAVVRAIAPEIRAAEIQRCLRKPPENLDAYDMYLRGQNALHLGHLDDAFDWLSKAIETAPDFAKAKALSSWLGTAGHLYGRRSTEDTRDVSLKNAYEAMELEPSDPEVTAYS